MAVPPKRIPRVNSQPLSVDFIDNRLEKHHPAFKGSGGVQYDPKLGCYAPTRLTDSGAAMATNGAATPGAKSAGDALMPPRPELPAATKMKFWVTVFPEAMGRVKAEPGLELGAEYTIREKTNWDDVLAQLQKARESYDGTKKGFFGKFKRAARKIMDGSSVASQPVRLAKGVEYLSTPMAAVEILLEAS
ncbi:hypothetical protein Dda_2300 [Drechslerella dactyloides]|uniref:Uncharacterized protein n=1 Tax=Drechslerella dactyloides TaxID=74499 RepID=A0AAD6J5M7_DREDA|nr:hypothetical protein Dda_2300 [Drechslerella dactyloides]